MQRFAPAIKNQAPSKIWRNTLTYAGPLVLLLMLAALLAAHRRPWIDEGRFASPGVNLAYHGFAGTTVFGTDPRLPRIQEHTYWILPLHIVAQAVWYRLLGFGVIQLRWLSILLAAIGILSFQACVWAITHDRRIALVTGVLLSADYMLTQVATSGRQDAMCFGLALLGLWCYVQQREKSLDRAVLLSQIFLAASAFTHPNALLWMAVSLAWALALDRHRLRWRHVFLAAAPYALGALLWGAYIARDPAAFRDQMTLNAIGNDRVANWRAPWTAVEREITERYLTAYGLGAHSDGHTSVAVKAKAVVLAAFLIALIFVAARKSLRSRPGVRLILGTLCLVFVVQCFFNQKLNNYLIHILPFWNAILAVFLIWLWDSGKAARYAAVALGSAVILVQVGGTLWISRDDRYHSSYLPAMHFIEQHSSSSDVIVGSADMIFALRQKRKVFDDIYFGRYSGAKPEFIVIEEAYRANLDGIRMHSPADYQYDMDLLSNSFRLVYDQAFYRVYQRASR
jgi:hypothetical protein